MGNICDEVRLLDEEIKGIQGEIKSLEVMYEIHSLQQTLGKYDEIPVDDVILSATEEKLLSKLKESNSPLLNFPTVCDLLERNNKELCDLLRLRKEKLASIRQNTPQANQEIQGTSKTKAIPFPTPPGTQWHEVEIAFVDKESVSIKIKGKGKAVTKSYAEMGFKGRSTRKEEGKTSILWVNLRTLARSGGVLKDFPNTKANKIKESMSDLRKKLASYFKIEGDPIPYKKGKGYKTAFALKDKSHSREYEDSIRKQHKGYEPTGTENPYKDNDID
ncbi:MAG: hypothetical protein F9K48_02445 [Candidatus Brocadia sp.]|nr:MAG: hypothetical protein F9K48_02445 [Candidatus Brocadia sp.]